MNARFLAYAFAAVAGSLGCSESTTPDRVDPELSGAARMVAERVAAEAGAALMSVRPNPLNLPPAMSAQPALGLADTHSLFDGGCPTAHNTADADADGVPDDATLVFELPHCRFTLAGDTIEVTGRVRIMDPVASPPPSPAAFGVVMAFDALSHRVTSARFGTVRETRSGREAMMVDASRFTAGRDMVVEHRDDNGTATVHERWNTTFTPLEDTHLRPGHELPAGHLTLAGQSHWASGEMAAVFELGTVVPLSYDPACPVSAPNRFRSGEIRVHHASPDQEVVASLVFSNCEEPRVTVHSRSR